MIKYTDSNGETYAVVTNSRKFAIARLNDDGSIKYFCAGMDTFPDGARMFKRGAFFVNYYPSLDLAQNELQTYVDSEQVKEWEVVSEPEIKND